MKPAITLLLALSFTANVALLGIVLSHRPAQPKDTATARSIPVATKAIPAGSPDVWANLSSDAPPADLVKRLRASGFPESIITAIITTQIREKYDARRAALQKEGNKYWTKNWSPDDINFLPTDDPKMRAALRAISKDHIKELRDALGSSYTANRTLQRMIEREFSNLPPDKLKALLSIAEDYRALGADIGSAANGLMIPDDWKKMEFLEKEKRKDLAGLLTPKELEDYEMRTTSTASTVRHRLREFSPSEQEFRSIFALQRQFDLQYPHPNRQDITEADAIKQRTAAAALENQIKESLGETRYADYQRSQDSNFQQLSSIATRLELPRETAIAVYDLSKDMQKRIQVINSNPKLDTDQRNQALAALGGEANTKIAAALGERGLEAYRANGGWWLCRITPRPVQ